MNHALEDWLLEFDIPSMGGQPDPGAGGPPMGDPNSGVGNPANPPGPNVANPPVQDDSAKDQEKKDKGDEDVSNDPNTPDMPEDDAKVSDFEVWKKNYFKESIVGDTNKLIDMLNQFRGKKGLQRYQNKFVNDNYNIQILRQNANFDKASKEIRKMIKEQLDQNNPATTVVNHISEVLETIPLLNNIYIKLNGYDAMKGDLHRKYIAALTGSVQVGAGANTEDIIFNDKDYSIMMSTRFNSQWGEIMLGSWMLKEDDAERYLTEPEVKRLKEGSPEEKDVLRRRVVMESIAKQFETRAFIINIVGEDGTVYSLGWDLASSLKSAYTEGKLKVKAKHADNSEAMIDQNGEVVPFLDLSICYTKENGQQNEDGLPDHDEIEFIERKNGVLFLVADFQAIKEAAGVLQGMVIKETPYNGNPSDLEVLTRCVYSTHDLLMRQC